MKAFKLFIPIFLLWKAVAAQVPASPVSVKIKQPDGTSITIIGKGTMYVHYTETLDGYVLTLNSKGVYEYAVPDSTGDLVVSGIKAHDANIRPRKEKVFLKTLNPHLRYTGKKLETLLEQIK